MAGQKETGAYKIAAIVNAPKQMQILKQRICCNGCPLVGRH